MALMSQTRRKAPAARTAASATMVLSRGAAAGCGGAPGRSSRRGFGVSSRSTSADAIGHRRQYLPPVHRAALEQGGAHAVERAGDDRPLVGPQVAPVPVEEE